jgi:hypothetical protein
MVKASEREGWLGRVSEDGEIHRHSGWLIPLGLFTVVAALSGIFLLYDLRPAPGPFRDNRPTAAVTRVGISIRGLTLTVPARYIESRTARSGGDQDVVPLFAALPDMRGYTEAQAALFAGNEADSPIVHLLLRADTNSLDMKSRLARIYMPYIIDPKGDEGPFALAHYAFRADSGYGRDDLYSGGGGEALFLCERPAEDIPSPNCLAIDRPIAPGVNISYRFKRTQLSRWREIGEGANRLITSFRK